MSKVEGGMKLSLKVGLPRALFYQTYHPLWRTFYAALGVETVVSPETNKAILDQGVKCVVDETCLPVKVFFGHAANLSAAGVDYLFVPRMVSVEKKAYICPKFMGLPDMLKASNLKLPPLIMPVINLVKATDLKSILWDCAAPFTGNWSKIKNAWQEAWQEQKRHEENLIEENLIKKTKGALDTSDTADLTILVLGHDYNLHDQYLNMGLLEKLRELGCAALTPAQTSRKERELQLKKFPRSIFWTYGRNLLGSVYSFLQYPERKGVIMLTSFGCGIDSFMGNLIIRRLVEKKIPYLNVIIDEHTGEGGLRTRIEAFVDMIQWRSDYHQNYVSAYGQYLGSTERNA